MARGGRRPRRIDRSHVAVCCPGGRWGPRRTRVTECYAILKAEDVYTSLLKDSTKTAAPGAHGTASYTLEGRTFTASWEVRQNAVWRRGRVFLRCSRCERRCTRLYLPLATSWLACRRCWGLTYASRTLYNYKDSLWGRGRIARMFGTSQRQWAYQWTADRQQKWRARSRERWAHRRSICG